MTGQTVGGSAFSGGNGKAPCIAAAACILPPMACAMLSPMMTHAKEVQALVSSGRRAREVRYNCHREARRLPRLGAAAPHRRAGAAVSGTAGCSPGKGVAMAEML